MVNSRKSVRGSWKSRTRSGCQSGAAGLISWHGYSGWRNPRKGPEEWFLLPQADVSRRKSGRTGIGPEPSEPINSGTAIAGMQARRLPVPLQGLLNDRRLVAIRRRRDRAYVNARVAQRDIPTADAHSCEAAFCARIVRNSFSRAASASSSAAELGGEGGRIRGLVGRVVRKMCLVSLSIQHCVLPLTRSSVTC